MGETAADLLNEHLHLGLTRTTAVMGVLLVIALIVQFRKRRYVPAIYWLVVVLHGYGLSVRLRSRHSGGAGGSWLTGRSVYGYFVQGSGGG